MLSLKTVKKIFFTYSIVTMATFLTGLSLNGLVHAADRPAHESIKERKQFALRAGPTLGVHRLRARANTEDIKPVAGFNTQISYQKSRWEFAASSYGTFGALSGLNFQTQELDFEAARGRFRNLAIGPTIKYSPRWGHWGSFHLYYGVGAIWSQRTINLSLAQVSGDFDFDNTKIAYESRGAILQLGLAQLMGPNRAHPFYIDLTFIYSESRNVTLVDTENFRKTEILNKKDAVNHIQGTKLLLSFGITLF